MLAPNLSEGVRILFKSTRKFYKIYLLGGVELWQVEVKGR